MNIHLNNCNMSITTNKTPVVDPAGLAGQGSASTTAEESLLTSPASASTTTGSAPTRGSASTTTASASNGPGAPAQGAKAAHVFTRYQAFVIALIAILQFTVIFDFMIMAPLGAQMMRVLAISPSHFGWVVSAYAFSAGVSGILAAGFADKFDRKKMLLFFYTGFIIGTIFCGIAPGYQSLVLARIVTGLFGGVLF